MSINKEMHDDFFRLTGDTQFSQIDFDKTGNYTGNKEAMIHDRAEWDQEETNLLTSRILGKDGQHKIVLDLDLDAALIPSTTPGHHHLIIDKVLDWDKYVKLLKALADAGVIEAGYYQASIENGYTAVRTPWTKKAKTKVTEKAKAMGGALKGVTSTFQSLKASSFSTDTIVWNTSVVTPGSTLTVTTPDGETHQTIAVDYVKPPATLTEFKATTADPFAEIIIEEPTTTDDQSAALQAQIGRM